MGDRIGIVGAGNSARALAAWLASRGHEVHLLVRDKTRCQRLVDDMAIVASGKLEGRFALSGIHTDPAIFAAATRTIFVATVTTAYPDVAERLASHLRPLHELILFSGKFGACVEVERMLNERSVYIPVIETDALFACRIQPDDSIWIRGVKQWTLYSSPRASQTQQHGDIVRRYFPNLEPARNVIQRGLTDFGALCHPVIMLANINNIDREQPFAFYYEGLTDRTVRLLERLEAEFKSVAAAYDTPLLPMSKVLDRYYGCEGDTLLAAMRTVPNYRHSVAPTTLQHRYLTEDVPNTLVPLYYLARKAGVDTPALDSVIHMASIVTGEDFLETGRTLERLSWAHMNHHDIIGWINN
jgi:opine dehydrogenase